jgi:DNA-binding winged helix-turn-helix (wHTH) protein
LKIQGVKLLEAEQALQARREGTRLIVTVPRVGIHEIVVVELA